MLTVAIIGRPNVGKSTLFNRLTQGRGNKALVDPRPGATRDRRYGKATFDDQTITFIDTAGLEKPEKQSLEAQMMAQTDAAIAEADVLLLVVDARAGLVGEDREMAKKLRKSGKPVVLGLNKSESLKSADILAEFAALGFETTVALSAEHGLGMTDLWETLFAFAPQETETKNPEAEGPIRIAVIGRPNAGKSTLINQLLGEERVIANAMAGTTRDAIAVPFTYDGKKLELIDTAGMRRKSRIEDELEKRSVGDALNAIRFCHIALLVVDAASPLDKQDITLADFALKEGRVLVIAINKWDQVANPQALLGEIHHSLGRTLAQVSEVRTLPLSALSGYNVNKLMDEALGAYEKWNTEISTSQLNRWLEVATEQHSPPQFRGRQVHLRYATQSNTRPPTFLLFSSTQGDIPEHYRRYLQHHLSEYFDLKGIPIRIFIRKKKNPYDDNEA